MIMVMGDTEVVDKEAIITSTKVDLQNEMNDQSRMLNTNTHLGRGKRKAEHHKLNFGTLKRIKLDNAGSNNRFRTVKNPLKDDSTWGDLVKNFTDFSKGT